MHRDHVFDFIKLGRFIERADMLSRIIEDQILRKDARIPKYYENLQWMSILKSISGFESFKKINKEELRRANVLNFIFKLKEFPRSITFCINRLIAVSNYLPKSDDLEKKEKEKYHIPEKNTTNDDSTSIKKLVNRNEKNNDQMSYSKKKNKDPLFQEFI